MRYVFTALSLLSLVGLASSYRQQQKPQETAARAEEFKVPPEYVNKPNPTKPTPAALGEARRIYGYDCAMCHGDDGSGKSELAEQMKLQLSDWRDPASLEKKTDGELFYIIIKGKGKMGPEGDRVKEEQCWQLVNLVRSFAKKKAEAPKPPAGLL